MYSISIQYNNDEFVGVEAIGIVDNVLTLYGVNEETQRSLVYDDLKYYAEEIVKACSKPILEVDNEGNWLG